MVTIIGFLTEFCGSWVRGWEKAGMETYDQILCEHYGRMLGLTDGWKVEGVDLSLQERELKLRLAWGKEGAVCPECGKSLPRHDLSPERKWRKVRRMKEKV